MSVTNQKLSGRVNSGSSHLVKQLGEGFGQSCKPFPGNSRGQSQKMFEFRLGRRKATLKYVSKIE